MQTQQTGNAERRVAAMANDVGTRTTHEPSIGRNASDNLREYDGLSDNDVFDFDWLPTIFDSFTTPRFAPEVYEKMKQYPPLFGTPYDGLDSKDKYGGL